MKRRGKVVNGLITDRNYLSFLNLFGVNLCKLVINKLVILLLILDTFKLIMASSEVAVETKSVINLKGSAEIIRDFMDFSINMILYQREVYADEEFEKIEKYGRPLFMTTNTALKEYLSGVLK